MQIGVETNSTRSFGNWNVFALLAVWNEYEFSRVVYIPIALLQISLMIVKTCTHFNSRKFFNS